MTRIPGQRKPADDIGGSLAAARDGDSEAFGRVYAHYHPAVLKYVRFRVADPHAAADITSDTFLRAWRSIGRYEDRGRSYLGLLTTIARNIIIDRSRFGASHFERTTDGEAEFEEYADPDPGPEASAITAEIRAAVAAALQALPERQRQAIRLTYFDGLSTTEAGALLGVSGEAVKALTLRGRYAMRPVLAEMLRS